MSNESKKKILESVCDWKDLFEFWCTQIASGHPELLGDLGSMKIGYLLHQSEEISKGIDAIQTGAGNDQTLTFNLAYYLLALRGTESLRWTNAASTGQDTRVSLIIPVHNRWVLTMNCLRSIVTAKTAIEGVEIIIADDGSHDDTEEIIRKNEWLIHARMERNSGFIDNCNHAATFAKGEIIVFLNNDTMVGDNWLDELLDTFRRTRDCAIVGSQVYGSDGSLLESGGIIWRTGEVWNSGRRLEKEGWFKVDYQREVDYVSGCAMAIKREMWDLLGGFDTLYRPAYFEDTDICMRAHAYGKKVVVQPHSRILHFEGLSNSKGDDKGLKKYQKINQLKFISRWKDAISLHPEDKEEMLMASDRGLRNSTCVLLVVEMSDDALKKCNSKLIGLTEAFFHSGMKVIIVAKQLDILKGERRCLEMRGSMCIYGDDKGSNWREFVSNNTTNVKGIYYITDGSYPSRKIRIEDHYRNTPATYVTLSGSNKNLSNEVKEWSADPRSAVVEGKNHMRELAENSHLPKGGIFGKYIACDCTCLIISYIVYGIHSGLIELALVANYRDRTGTFSEIKRMIRARVHKGLNKIEVDLPEKEYVYCSAVIINQHRELGWETCQRRFSGNYKRFRSINGIESLCRQEYFDSVYGQKRAFYLDLRPVNLPGLFFVLVCFGLMTTSHDNCFHYMSTPCI